MPSVNMCGLLTKCEVKMAGYWLRSFFACLWTETKSEIALSFALNRFFFLANENGTVKQNNQSDFKAFF